MSARVWCALGISLHAAELKQVTIKYRSSLGGYNGQAQGICMTFACTCGLSNDPALCLRCRSRLLEILTSMAQTGSCFHCVRSAKSSQPWHGSGATVAGAARAAPSLPSSFFGTHIALARTYSFWFYAAVHSDDAEEI